ncbi:dihydropteroate synthase [Jiangella rhizosphaerae]|uniref:Dihydropteroate synthase n=1 Tax=Jiangella rhizosphaerae TaxID=2293569 RepID=A0A418KV89_9ACTN|nr:dihydropteroate synthase [Jiangella rhizosphaerae]RIQ33700.1 dihydropteroate synthase [Jiangella rhizosphaerae]
MSCLDAQIAEPEHRPQVIGVLNVTPDSFSDGGLWADPATAVEHGLVMVEDGAGWVEVGGESTRPGTDRTPEREERRRVVPVVERLTAAGVTYICMHWRGHSRTMQQRATYDDVTREVVAELRRQLDAARAAGIDADRLVVDPGLGFAKTAEHNWRLLHDFARLRQELGYPVLLGASRKSFLGRLLAGPDGRPRPPRDRDHATTVLSAYAYAVGAWGVRVHAPAASRDAIDVAQRLRAAARRTQT